MGVHQCALAGACVESHGALPPGLRNGEIIYGNLPRCYDLGPCILFVCRGSFANFRQLDGIKTVGKPINYRFVAGGNIVVP